MHRSFITDSANTFQNTSTFYTRLSDFHKPVVIVLMTSFRKTAPKEMDYRDYNKFNTDDFKTELKQNLAASNSNYENFEQAFSASLDKYAPCKSKTIISNHVPYMTQNLGKAIVKRSQLKAKCFKTNTARKFAIIQQTKEFLT